MVSPSNEDPPNLVNADPDPGQKITKFISNPSFKVKKKKKFKSVP